MGIVAFVRVLVKSIFESVRDMRDLIKTLGFSYVVMTFGHKNPEPVSEPFS